MDKEIINRNDKFRLHGYQEWYVDYDKIVLRVNFKNGSAVGYQEYHQIELTNFYIK